MGRQSTFTAELADAICERIAKGEPLAQICRDEGMPSDKTVRNWAEDNKEFSSAIARARIDGFDAIADYCVEIADNGRNDWMEKNGGSELNSEHVQRSKLRIETRLKLLAKWDPKRYGDKLELASDPNAPFTVVVRKLTS